MIWIPTLLHGHVSWHMTWRTKGIFTAIFWHFGICEPPVLVSEHLINGSQASNCHARTGQSAGLAGLHKFAAKLLAHSLMQTPQLFSASTMICKQSSAVLVECLDHNLPGKRSKT